MNTNPLVSVIVPVYNVLPYLGQALDSVLAQTHRNLEIVVVDDGSTDGSSKLCDEYARRDGRVAVIHQKNCGLSAARNIGVDNATGNWILFLDSDDWMEPNTVEALLREAGATGADIICCQRITEQVGASTAPQETQHTLYESDDALFAHVCSGKIGPVAWGKLYRARLFDGIRYPEGRVFEDLATTWRIIGRASHVACIPDALFHYRLRQSSIARGHSMDSLVDYWTAYVERYRALAGRSDEYRHAVTQQCVAAIGRTWCWCNESPRDEHTRHAEKLSEMSSFARAHTEEVLHGRYPLQTQALCFAGRWESPFVWRAMHAANSLRRSLRRQRMYA